MKNANSREKLKLLGFSRMYISVSYPKTEERGRRRRVSLLESLGSHDNEKSFSRSPIEKLEG